MRDIESFQTYDDLGALVDNEVICEFQNDETGEYYIAYVDGEEDEDGDPVITVSRIDPDAEDLELFEVTEKERPFVEAVLEEILSELSEEEDE
jgi:uncharacterized protein YrzB (UPF0473 family)